MTDLKRGNKAQLLVKRLFDECGLQSEIIGSKDPNRSFWDITSVGHDLEFTTEVKYDEYESLSNNIAIETFNPRLGKPSGIGVTKAFFWAHVLKNGATWITPCSKLRQFIESTIPKKIIKRGGDNNAELYLYDSGTILSAIFIRIDGLTISSRLQCIKEFFDGR